MALLRYFEEVKGSHNLPRMPAIVASTRSLVASLTRYKTNQPLNIEVKPTNPIFFQENTETEVNTPVFAARYVFFWCPGSHTYKKTMCPRKPRATKQQRRLDHKPVTFDRKLVLAHLIFAGFYPLLKIYWVKTGETSFPVTSKTNSTKKTLKNHYHSCFLLFGVVPKYHLY